jgi:hypothetical protein
VARELDRHQVERGREVVLTSVAVYFDQNRDVRHNFQEGVMYNHGSAAKHRTRSSPAVASVVTVDGRRDVDLWEVEEEAYVRIVADGQLVALGWEAGRCMKEKSWRDWHVSVPLDQHIFNDSRDSKASFGELYPLRLCESVDVQLRSRLRWGPALIYYWWWYLRRQ